jgi:hypothetical protein
LKIPMQFLILLLGILLYVFYQFSSSTPIFFNKVELQKLEKSQLKSELKPLQDKFEILNKTKQSEVLILQASRESGNEMQVLNYKHQLKATNDSIAKIKKEVVTLIKKNNPDADTNDVNYIFLRYVLDYLPHGLIGLLIAVIFSASMGSIASAYNSLASTSMIDVYSKIKIVSTENEVNVVKILTFVWGVFCIFIASFAHKFGSSMIELVNILGSWFYGVILGIFVLAFYFKKIGSTATFYSAVISQILVIIIWYFDIVAFLWLNPIGCLLVVFFAFLMQLFIKIENLKEILE